MKGLTTYGPRLFIGDFNCVLNGDERSSGGGVSTGFVDWVDSSGLVDLGFSGPIFTWNHGVNLMTRRSARLDRALSDVDWRQLFPEASVRHLPHTHSDHCPVLLRLEESEEPRLGSRPFKFQNAWLTHPDFLQWMSREWSCDGNLTSSLKDFSTKLVSWNRVTFGHIFKRKKRNFLRLEGVQRCLALRVTEAHLKLEARLKEEQGQILLQEELLWQQKSHVDWLRYGDANTTFFHTSTLVRQRRNKITALQDAVGNWVESKGALQNMALQFYDSLFLSNPEANGVFPTGLFPPIPMSMRLGLEADYSIDETKRALQGMGSSKAPGPDGFHPGFFKHTWDMTGSAVHDFAKDILGGKEVFEEAAEALLVLIPKDTKPTSIKGFRPISLCNVSLKIVTEMLVNRLKLVLKKIVAPNQASLIPGRQSIVMLLFARSCFIQ